MNSKINDSANFVSIHKEDTNSGNVKEAEIKSSTKKIIQIIPLLSLLIITFMTYANTIDDLDLWWHLKSGQVIYETHTIPQKDDFAFTSYIPENISKTGTEDVDTAGLTSEKINSFLSSGFIKRNWLSQLIFYVVYLSSGFTGIGIMKSSIFVIALIVLYLTMLKRGAGQWTAFFVLCLIAYIGKDFNYTRPQIFSFLMFTCMLYTLYDFKKGGKSIYFLPVLMIIWANLHGGIILGVIIVVAFTFAELIKYLLHNALGISKMFSMHKRQLQILALFVAGSAFASLISPSGYKTFLFPWILKKSIFGTIEEYHRPMIYEYHTYWFMLLLVIICALILIFGRRLDLVDLFLCMTVILPSLKSNKYIIYFALGTSVFLAYSITYAGISIKERDLYKKLFNKTGISKLNLQVSLPLLLAILSVVALIQISSSDEVLRFDTREKRYPSGAVTFIQENKLSGNMFNLFNWGGYIVWHLYPDHRVFIYGRAVNETAFFHYNQIANAISGNDAGSARPIWKRLLDTYNVNFILTSALTSTGNIIPLVDRLYQDGEWELIYEDGKSMIFLKASQDNYDIIHQLYLSKEKIYDEIISEGRQGIAETPATWGYYETLGFVYMKQNRFNDALIMFEKYLSMNPNNQKVRESYELLKRYEEKYQ